MSDPLHIMPPRSGTIAGAIAATEQVKMLQLGATLSPGRPVMIAVPANIGPLEALAFVGWVGNELAQRIASRPSARILVPK